MNLGARFRIVRPLGGQARQGALLARDLLLGKPCVLKLTEADSTAGDLLRAEADRLGEIEHPRIVRILTRFRGVTGRNTTVSGFAMNWVDGGTITAENAGLPLSARLLAFGQILDAVSHLHALGLLHLDVKPDNVLCCDGEVTLLDLGSAAPIDAGPGEAGGTLGYASPEVLAGHAASVASDLYSLGAVLYELLCGQRPYTELTGPELRTAAINAPVLPVRALAPDVPRPLARLAEDLLQLHPVARPRSARDVMGRIEEAGFPLPVARGAPPFSGRSRELLVLSALLDGQGPATISVVGPGGSGRSRLVRRALLQWSDGVGSPALDLSDASDPLKAVHRLLDAQDEGVPVFFGRRDELSPSLVAAIDAVTPALVKLGCRVLWAANTRIAGTRSVMLEPLDEAAVANIGRFVKVAEPDLLRAALRRSGGWPSALLQVLAPQGGGTLAADLEEARQALAALPAGIPPEVLPSLSPSLIARIPALVASRAAWWGDDRKLYVAEATRPDMPAELLPVVERILAEGQVDADPLWFALLAVRVGRLDLARSIYAAALTTGAERPRELAELTRLLAAAGDRAARRGYASLELRAGHPEEVLRVLADARDRTLEEDIFLVQALRMAGRETEAEDEARAVLSRGGPPSVWLEVARCRMSRGDLDGADGALTHALHGDPTLSEGDGLTLAITLAVRRIDRNEDPPGVDALVARVDAAGDNLGIPSPALSAFGRMLIRKGALDRGERLLARAARLADAEGDARRAAGIRLNRANALVDLGRGREAREVYQSALMIAERAGLADMQLRVRYSLADLELRSGRIPAADVHTRECEQLALAAGDPEARARSGLLRARTLQATGELAAARAILENIQPGSSGTAEVDRVIALGQVLLDLGDVAGARALVEGAARPTAPLRAALLDMVWGRIQLSMARTTLARARGALQETPEPMNQMESGEILLAAAGEDLDPATFPQRRKDLGRAVTWLRGDPASRAATLRDRLLEGPGAGLMGIVALTEAMRDPRRFPSAVARLVTEALGANRVLLMMRMPGLGRVTHTELTGAEAAGISEEVLRRIRKPDDVWVAPDAFADPELRKSSHTVRTFQLRSLLAVAIPQGDFAVGALYVDDLHRTNRFGPADVMLLQRLARAVGGMLPVLSAVERSDLLEEPRDLHGVLVAGRKDAEAMEAAVQVLRNQAAGNLLITGETGSGKTAFAERFAKEVLGLEGVEVVVMRRGDPQMLVSTLGGARRGDFTGAENRTGAISRAISGRKALMLDEVQNLDEAGQQILLPLLDLPNRLFGGLAGGASRVEQPIHILMGTNADVERGRWREIFRADLWYRMSQVHIHLVPLRDRGPEVVYRYLARMLAGEGLPAPEDVLDTDLLNRVTRLEWPGNLRELRHFTTRVAGIYGMRGRRLGLDDLPGLLPEGEEPRRQAGHPGTERDLLLETLNKHHFQQNLAARALGMSPSQLNKQLRRLGLLEMVRRGKRGE